ncbi:hypothetical protein FHG89_11500 [Micromonospora orduensis]|uniref:Aminoacyl-transfer RNA synthetases class-II family profile domain-containing protein n=1 Tax=Micromonospora orduensis TaxID=1420891 RepID=A0A5C4QU90_9ACTN|nr:hypothetical protein [Micromonospora orduensis]TNH29626.1 hypothetical protein FHG89_11500 [Micromonospora orduensis]
MRTIPIDVAMTQNGLCTLQPAGLSILESVDAKVLGWAARMGAAEVRLPPLVSVADLVSIDYFDNFPHLPVLVSRVADPASPAAVSGTAPPTVGRGRLVDADYALPSSACYGVYFNLRSTSGLGPTRITTRSRCFRNEASYDGLRRLWSFEMREIVYLGDAGGAAEHLATAKRLISDWCAELGLDVGWRTGSDPFFDARHPRAIAQRVAPIKEELLYKGELAIASVNAHRNFFGERCDITDEAGAPIHTSCVGFGLERWIAALLDSGRSAEEALALVRQS